MNKQITNMRHVVKMAVLSTLTSVWMATTVSAATVSVDFDSTTNATSGGGGTMLPADVAGAFPVANWTTVNSPGTATNLKDNSGTATSLDITSVTRTPSGSPFFLGQANDGFTTTPDAKMMGDTAGVNGNGSVFLNVTLDQIPYLQYDLYVYLGTDVNTNRGGSVTTDNSSTTFFYKGSNVLNSYIQSTETGSFAASGTANYVRFQDLTGSSLTISSEAIVEQTFITGFQVVDTFVVPPVPEPSSLALLSLGVLGMIRTARRKHV